MTEIEEPLALPEKHRVDPSQSEATSCFNYVYVPTQARLANDSSRKKPLAPGIRAANLIR